MDWHMYNTTMMTSNSSTGYNAMVTFVQQTSQATSYLPGVAILLSFWLVLFFALRTKGNPAKVCVVTASWAVTMVALLMYPLGIINSLTYIISIVITPVSILALFLMADD
jgi:hypothetical protein